jgi:transcriptional regulator
MYNPSAFQEEDLERIRRFIRGNPLAMLISARNDVPAASHLPTFLDTERNVLRAHMAKANPHWQALENAQVLTIFHGVDHYISPAWYPSTRETGRVVPTWNYVTVHVEGVARLFDTHERLLSHVTELTAENETALNLDWKVSDAPADYIENLLHAIVGVEIAITAFEGKWKVSQNRSASDREGAAQGLEGLQSARSQKMAQLIRRHGH